MITFEEFLEIFKTTSFSRKNLVEFYQSIKKSVSLGFVSGRKAQHKLLDIHEKYQWPIIRELDNPQLDIYKDVEDSARMEEFIKSIKDEKKASNPQKTGIIWERAQKLYPAVFGFSDDDIEYCRKVGERYDQILKRKKKGALLKGGITAGIIGATGAGAYLIVKKMKEKKEIKGKVVEGKIKRDKPS